MSTQKVSGGEVTFEVDSPVSYSQIPVDTYFKDNSLGIVLYKNQSGTVVNPWASSSGGGSTYELLGVITYEDINDNAGQASFAFGSYAYAGRALISVLAKKTTNFDVDSVGGGVQDVDTQSQLIASESSTLNGFVIVSASSGTPYLQGGDNLSLLAVNLGKGSFAGGNTQGSISVYGLFASMP